MAVEGRVSAGRPHPLGVKPSGNALSLSLLQQQQQQRQQRQQRQQGRGRGKTARCAGDSDAAAGCAAPDAGRERLLTLAHAVGRGAAVIGDDLVLGVLGMLDARSLAAFGCASHASFVYASFDELWRDLAMARLPEVGSSEKKGAVPQGEWRFLGTWKASVLASLGGAGSGSGEHGKQELEEERFVPRGSVCSDTLFRPWQYATAEISADWTTRQVVETRQAASLSVDQFVNEFERPGVPVLIKGALGSEEWPVVEAWGAAVSPERPWRPSMRSADGSAASFRVGPVDMRMCDFLSYAERQTEETPLYLFDCKFVEKLLGGEVVFDKADNSSNDVDADSAPLYRVPKYFLNSREHPHRDLFECLGRRRRPDFRWLTAGAAKSGSRWHIDPNATHAWNGIVSGAKRWILFPPGCPPPGVRPSDDGAEVTQPVSLLEWFANFYSLEQAPVEFTARAGDLVFVPQGWWHCVLNIEPCVAITQNYVSDTNLSRSLAFMRDHPDLVAGCKHKAALHSDLRHALSSYAPALLEKVGAEDRARQQKLQARAKRRVDADTDPGFSFSFF